MLSAVAAAVTVEDVTAVAEEVIAAAVTAAVEVVTDNEDSNTADGVCQRIR